MTRGRAWRFAFKHLFLLTLCVCLLAGLSSKPVKTTVSYVTSLSATCVNTFTGEGQTEPEPSDPSTDPDSPPTGDNTHREWYVLGVLISLAGLAAVWKPGRKKDGTQ